MANRVYAVWINGQRISTERRIAAAGRDAAIWEFAKRNGVKTIQCNAQWLRGEAA